jgi:hypothetical protein
MKKFLFIAFASLLVFACNHNPKSTENNETNTISSPQEVADFHAKLCVAPPIKNLNVVPKSFIVKPSEAKTLHPNQGTSIDIPANAFVDKQGKPITVPVEIKYREFRSVGEIIASGIPMKSIGPDGQEGWMQTAGMYEINGFANGEAVFIAPDKKVKVSLASDKTGKYDFWRFDEQAGNWIDIGDSEPTPAPKSDEKTEIAAKETPISNGHTAGVVSAPKKPVLLDKTKPSLNFKIDYTDFPELKAMKGMVLQYSGNDSRIDPANNLWIFRHQWEKIDLKPAKTEGNYTLNLESDSTEYQIPVCPSLNAREYEVALRDFEKIMADYKKIYAAEAKRAIDVAEYQKVQEKFVRSMELTKFGIHNYDIFWKNEQNIHLMADFNLGAEMNATQKSMVTVYLIFKGGTMVVGFPNYSWEKFSFDPKSTDNQLVAVLPDGSVTTFTSQDFAKVLPQLKTLEKSNYTFDLKLNGKKINSIGELDGMVAMGR